MSSSEREAECGAQCATCRGRALTRVLVWSGTTCVTLALLAMLLEGFPK